MLFQASNNDVAVHMCSLDAVHISCICISLMPACSEALQYCTLVIGYVILSTENSMCHVNAIRRFKIADAMANGSSRHTIIIVDKTDQVVGGEVFLFSCKGAVMGVG